LASIGRSITVRGDLFGEEDLVLEGLLEGRIELPNHQLTIGAGARVRADIRAKAVTIRGEVSGNVTATERVDLEQTAVLEGDLACPRLAIQEGARVNGNVTMAAGAPALASTGEEERRAFASR
jgi:cytoskeletal protein CcmA (bactofilin family)